MDEYYCPVKLTADVMNGNMGAKWKPPILFYREDGTHRFGELRRRIPGMTKKMLTQYVRELERDGIIHRKVYAVVAPKLKYSLTRRGESRKPETYSATDVAWGTRQRTRYGIPKSKSVRKELLLRSSADRHPIQGTLMV
jgi:DNA-binding HxlR family transcriptional regulator